MEDYSIYYLIPEMDKEGVVVQYDKSPYFYDKIHYHPEVQLIYILEGTGSLFIGDNITRVNKGDLFLIGSNQSHLFKCDEAYYKNDPSLCCRSVSVYLNNQILEEIFKLVDASSIQRLIKRSKLGIKFYPSAILKVRNHIKYLLNDYGFKRFIKVLDILYSLSESNHYKQLSSINTVIPIIDDENKRVNDVINYIMNHYTERIELKEVADVANYSIASFSRFFKRRTRKTFSQFVNEIRISHACRLLMNTDLKISQVCYKSGFNNVSNFNRQFKRVKGITPKEYLEDNNAAFKNMSEIRSAVTA
ncbi:MAG TPA: AraC family transcriptional regulator [Balneolales bacterium]|nr:AraC family transcriptional regulator [Balneolales bacterium]